MTGDIDFVNWLAAGYHDNGLDWHHENYEREACRRYRENDVVYLVWQDATKPGNVDFMLCKNWQPLMRTAGYGFIPCNSKEGARQLWELLCARGWNDFQI